MFKIKFYTKLSKQTITLHYKLYIREVTEAQLHEVDLLLECVLIRDGQAALPCWFPMSDIQSIVNYICTM